MTPTLPSTPATVFASLMKQLAEAGRTPPAAPATPSTPEALAAALFELAARTGAVVFSVWADEAYAESSGSGDDDEEVAAPAAQIEAGISFFFVSEDSPERVPVRQPIDPGLYRPLGQALAAHAKRGSDPKLPQRGSVSFPDPDLEFRVSFRDTALGTWTTAFARDREARQAYPPIHRLPLPADAAAFLEESFRNPAQVLFSGQVVLLTGAPQTGRSTTLRALMDALPDNVHALAAVEEPRPGAGGAIGVMRVDGERPLTQMVRAFLRQDPDFLFADEVRTLEDMQMLCNGALTGHAAVCVVEASKPEDGYAWMTEALPGMPMAALIVHHTRDSGTGAFAMTLHEAKPMEDTGAVRVVPWTPPA